MQRKVLDGLRFGRLRVLEWQKKNLPERSGYLCLCECGEKTVVPSVSLTSGRTKSCGCLLHDQPWKGVGNLSGNYWFRCRRSAVKRGWEFEVDISQAWELFLKQEKRCALTGRLLHMEKSYLNPRRKDIPKQTASFDRIDSTKGYVVGNVQWIHVDVNYMKQEMGEVEFVQTCEEIIKWHRRSKNLQTKD